MGAKGGSEPELSSLRREVETLRERVAELQRRAARQAEGERVRLRGDVEVTVSAREELLVEAERIAHVGSWVWDLETDGVFWSDEMFRILGYDFELDKASPEAFFARIHRDDVERIKAASARVLETGVGEQTDYRIVRPDGSTRTVTMTAALLFGDSGKLERLVGAVRDLTEEIALRQRMQSSLDLLEEAQTIAQMGNWTFDLVHGTSEWSRGLYRLLGLDPSLPPSPQLFFSVLHPEEREHVRAMHERGAASGDWTPELECRFVRPNGEVRRARVRSIAIRDAGGRILEFRGTMVDITDQTRLAERVAQVGKMEAVGRLAGGIAHDFNNLLTVIGANVELWAEAAGAENEIHDARRAVQSARSLTERLLAFGRKSQLARRVVDPNDLVSRTVDLVRRVIGDQVCLALDLCPSPPAICVDPALIEQALLNLVINARDAMPGGGTVTLLTRAVSASSVEIEVSDDGPGMDPGVKARIFEPFFTTKGDRGTGLGLPSVLGTIEQHGGTVEVRSEQGKGACFTLRLPADVRARPESLAPELRPPDAAPVGREILVVEDEPLVAAVIARSLERKGHTAHLAHRPSEAVRLWGEHPDVRFVICDVSMAEMRGPELVKILRQTGRDFRVLYVTGYDEEGALDTSGESVLSKPFSSRDLLRAIADAS